MKKVPESISRNSHVLEILNKRKVPCFVVSSKQQRSSNETAAQDLVAFFEEIIGSDAVTHYKPHPEGIQQSRVTLSLLTRQRRS